jgi:intracellular multiplication protein IcmE
MANEFDSEEFDDDFEDFDTGKGQSLKDLWANNPLIKLGIVVGAVVVVVGGIFLITGSGGDKDARSQVTAAPETREVLGDKEVTPAYADAINDENERRAEAALNNPDVSVIPTLVNSGSGRILDDIDQSSQDDDEQDPFKEWRIQEFNEQVEDSKKEINRQQQQFVESFDEAVTNAPDPEAVAALSDAMLVQMQAILQTQDIPPVSIMTIAPLTNENMLGPQGNQLAQNNSVLNASGMQQMAPQEPLPEPAKIVLPAGTVAYSQLLSEANTDAKSPILGQILDGKFKGARIIGSFTANDRYILMTFSRMTLKNKSYSINAVALNPDTNLAGMRTHYDGRYFRRIVLPAAAEFVEGLGSAIADDTQSTNVSLTGGTVITEKDNLDVKQELGRGVEEAARELGDIFDEEAQGIEPLIRVEAGTPLALFFTEDVLEDGSNPAATAAAAAGQVTGGQTGAQTGTGIMPQSNTLQDINRYLNQ